MADKAQKDWDDYARYRDDTREWREQRDRNEKFYYGDQWSHTMSNKLEARGQSDIVVNKIRALVRMRVSMMIAEKPTGKVFGVQKGDIEDATLFEEFADWHLYNSDWQFHLERAVMGQNRVGLHWLTLYSDNLADYGRGELKVGNEPYRHVFLDKGSGVNWDYSDAARIIETKQIRPMDWLNSLPPHARKKVEGDIESLLRPDDEIRWYGKHQHKKESDIWTPVSVTPSAEDKGDWIRQLDVYEKTTVDVPVALTADGVVVAEGDPDDGFNEVIEQQIAEGILTEQVVPQVRFKHRKNISGKMFLPLDESGKTEDILPISSYPLIPIVDEDTGNAMPLGEIDFQAGIQEILNTAVSLTLLNAALASNMKIVVDAGAAGITDIEQWRKRWAKPGEVLNMKQNPVTGEFPFDIVRPEPLSQAWFTLAQSLAQEIEFQISTFSLRTGDPTNAPSTFAATLQLGQWAQDILRIPLSRLELALERLFNLIFEWSPNYYDFNKIFYTLGSDGEPLYRTINFATREFTKARFRIRAGSTLPSQTVSELGILQDLAQLNPALIGSVIDRMPGLRDSDKQEIKQTIDVVSQLQQANAQKEDVIGVLQQQLQHLNEQNMALMRDNALDPLKREVDLAVKNIKDMRKGLEKTQNNSRKK